jgi:nitrogen fixation-related uncharacterized protein
VAGAIVVAIIIVILIPVSLMMSGAVVAGLLGWALKDDAAERYEGSELVDLNK